MATYTIKGTDLEVTLSKHQTILTLTPRERAAERITIVNHKGKIVAVIRNPQREERC